MTLEELDALHRTAERLRRIRRMLRSAERGTAEVSVSEDIGEMLRRCDLDVPDGVVRDVLLREQQACEEALRAAGVEA